MTAVSRASMLTWEYWRRGMLWFVAGNIAIALACTALLYSAVLGVLGLSYRDLAAELDKGLVGFVFWPPVVLSLAAWRALRFHYTRPVSTRELVAVSLANGAAATIVMVGTLVVAMRVMFGARWPFLAPAICSVVFYLFVQALLWCVSSSRVLAGLSVFAAIGIGAGASDAFVWRLVEPGNARAGLGSGPLLVMVLIAGLSYLLAVRGVACDRRGDRRLWAAMQRGWSAVSDAVVRLVAVARRPQATEATRRFRSAGAAQSWAEWRTKGRWPVWGVAIAVCGLTLGLRDATPRDAADALRVVTAMLVLILPMIGLWLGSDAGGFERRTFFATLPLSDCELAWAVLKNVAIVVACTSILWVAGAVGISWLWNTPEWGHLQREWDRGWAIFLQSEGGALIWVLIVWAICASAASLALARSWFVWSGGCTFLVVLALLLRFVPWEIAFPILAMFGLGVAVTVFAMAYSRRLIPGSVLTICITAWILLVAAVLLFNPDMRTRPGFQFYSTAFGSIPFAPFAAAPLALSWNRHR